MILADHISFNDDATAWWVPDPGEWTDYGSILNELDRPCGLCDGAGCDDPVDFYQCLVCDGTGRHTFTIEVEVPRITMWDTNARRTFRVSVVPDMVLPIVDIWPTDAPAIFHDPSSPVSEWWWTYAVPDGWNMPITLPPAATPGMFAVKLQVHS